MTRSILTFTNIFCSAVVACGLCATQASAASISYTLETSTSVAFEDEIFQFSDQQDQNSVPVEGNESAGSRSQAFSPSGTGDSFASSSFLINQSDGSVKFGAEASTLADKSSIGSRASSSVSLGLFETFTISGTGDITFSLFVDGNLSNSGTADEGGEGARVEARIRLIDNNGGFRVLGSDSLEENVGFMSQKRIGETLSFTTTITESQNYLFRLDLIANTRVSAEENGDIGVASANFFNTAYLSFAADDTLTVTASDPNFLATATGGPSNDPISPVPLPAGIWLMLAGLGALRMVRRA